MFLYEKKCIFLLRRIFIRDSNECLAHALLSPPTQNLTCIELGYSVYQVMESSFWDHKQCSETMVKKILAESSFGKYHK